MGGWRAMSGSNQGRIPIVDPENPQSWGRDDYTGLPIMMPDAIKQMEYIGNGLAWTGFMVHYKDADQPNPQLIPPRLKVDPVPIKNPRFMPVAKSAAIPTDLAATAISSTEISVTWTAVAGIPAYVVGWNSSYNYGETTNILTPNYTITGLTPGSYYLVQVASTADNSTVEDIQFTTSAFSDPVAVTMPT